MLELSDMASASPMIVRVFAGLIGGLILVAGARLYKPALLAAAFTAGGLLVVATLSTAGELVPSMATPGLLVAGALFGGISTAWTAHVAHRLALVLIGGLTGLTLTAALLALVSSGPWWLPLVGGCVGAVALPWVYTSLLKFLTPAVGAVCIAWAVGMPETPWVLGGLWAFGAAVQLAGPGPGGEADEEDA